MRQWFDSRSDRHKWTDVNPMTVLAIRKSISLTVITLTAYFLLVSCSGRQEYTSALRHFHQDYQATRHLSHEARSLAKEKLIAARYLVDNMPGHTAMIGDYEPYYREIDSVLSVSSDEWTVKDSVIKSISQAYMSRISYVPVADCVSDDYLVKDIEEAFDQWKNGAWAKHLDFEHFCEYLLPFTASDRQPIFNWRTEYCPVAYGSIGNLEECYDYKNDPHEAASAVNELLHGYISSQYRRIEPHEIPVFSPETFFKFPYAAACEENAELVTLIMRAKGIPTAIDFTPQWPDRRQGHSWCVIWSVHGRAESFSPFYSRPGVQFITHQRVSKVFRRMYAPNREYVKAMASLDHFASITGTPFFEDVTEEYTCTSDIDITLNRKPCESIAYIAVFDNFDWHPIWYGRVHGKRATFRGMGRDVTYIAMAFDGDRLVPFSDPFRLDRLGNVEYIHPDTADTDTLHIERKFPLRQHVYHNVGTLRNGIMEASENKIEWDTLALLPKWPLTSGSFEIENNKPYRYWRFAARDKRMSDMAEIFYYDSSSVFPVRNFQVIDACNGYGLLFDNDPLTYYRAEGDAYCGCVDFGQPVSLKRIEYILRGDGNAIMPGDTYEVSWWNNGSWQLLQSTTADNVWLDVQGAPSGALFYIKDLTRGEDNRIFQWDRRDGVVWR